MPISKVEGKKIMVTPIHTTQINSCDLEPIPEDIPNSSDPEKYIIYTVKKGDWLSKLAIICGTTVDELAHINDIEYKNWDTLKVGQQLLIPKYSPSKNKGVQEAPVGIVKNSPQDNLKTIESGKATAVAQKPASPQPSTKTYTNFVVSLNSTPGARHQPEEPYSLTLTHKLKDGFTAMPYDEFTGTFTAMVQTDRGSALALFTVAGGNGQALLVSAVRTGFFGGEMEVSPARARALAMDYVRSALATQPQPAGAPTAYNILQHLFENKPVSDPSEESASPDLRIASR